ncbi:CpaD family pilus assembly protein [uncultured Rhodoblastus sp.]|uniref:CpaD family pilus assembly protein n=1 Tax=uncultured Rhodoblastus sp. TaxID=543037 RepID=UPI0025FAEEB6|nr:CpaD family pilus assembly protein [uncultured Rhodoblastus sp.]
MPHRDAFACNTRNFQARQGRFLAALALALPLAACSGADRVVTAPVEPPDVRARHPIELTRGRASLDVLPEVRNREIDARTRAQVREFAGQYRLNGSGDIGIALPGEGPGAGQARSALPGLRRALVAGGARGYVLISTYRIADPALAAPIRLSYDSVVAHVRSRCGQWPNDLASGASLNGWENRPYWNFGCASQQMLATQTADPRDLIGPAAATPADSLMRGRAIDAVRAGKDPGTSWSVQNSNIGGLGN